MSHPLTEAPYLFTPEKHVTISKYSSMQMIYFQREGREGMREEGSQEDLLSLLITYILI